MHPVDVADWPVRIDASRQLFVDDYLIAAQDGLHRRLHQPRKHPTNPVMVAEAPWEGFGPVLAYCRRDSLGATAAWSLVVEGVKGQQPHPAVRRPPRAYPPAG
jgi:hypothetical protein